MKWSIVMGMQEDKLGIAKPFHRNWRAVQPGPNAGYSAWAYIRDKEYAADPAHYVRAYLLIQKDLELLFEYIEPSPQSLETYSYRIHALLMRACIEVEANFKAILEENKFSPKVNRFGKIYDMRCYKKINQTHHLSSYNVVLPLWGGPRRVINPFEAWGRGGRLDWYQAYNASKHDRQEKFKLANLENLISAVAGLLVVLSSQFCTEDFSAGNDVMGVNVGDYYEMDASIGGLFRIAFPNDWPSDEMYEFNWSELKDEAVRFNRFDYDLI